MKHSNLKTLLVLSAHVFTPFSTTAFADGKVSVQAINISGKENTYQMKSVKGIYSLFSEVPQFQSKNLLKVANEIYENEGVILGDYSLKEQSEIISKYITNNYNVNLDTQALNYHVIKDSLRASYNEATLSRTFNEARGLLNFDQKIFLAKEMGDLYATDYNYRRADEGTDSDGIVTLAQLNSALDNPIERGGVCRDIAIGQAQILQGLGVDDAYVVAFDTIDAGHATLVVEDANNPGRLIHLNYGELTSTTFKESLGLRQNTSIPDTGLFFRVYNTQGEPVASIPSELGQVLIEMTNGNLQEYDPGVRRVDANIGQATYYGEKFGVKGFTSKGPTGDRNTGASVFSGYGNKKNGPLYVEGGAALVQHESQRAGGNLKTTSVFARVQSGMKTPYYQTALSLRLRLEFNYMLTVQAGKGTYRVGDYENEGNVLSVNNHFNGGISGKWGEGTVHGEVGAKAYANIDKSDVRNEKSYGPEVTSYAFTNTVYYDGLDKYSTGLNTTIIRRPVGTSMTNSIMLRSRDGKGYYEVGYTDTLFGDKLPSWTPEGRKNVFFDMKFELPYAVSTKLRYVRYFENSEDMFLLTVEKKF